MHSCSNHKSCVIDATQKATEICYDKGLRFTELRQNVFKLIWESHRPAKAYDLLEKIKKEDLGAKPPTIYRTLDFLLETGLIHRLRSQNAYVGCSHPLQHKDCYFLICSQCQDIKECCNDQLKRAIAKTTKHKNFNPKNITLEIEGICDECAEKKS